MVSQSDKDQALDFVKGLRDYAVGILDVVSGTVVNVLDGVVERLESVQTDGVDEEFNSAESKRQRVVAFFKSMRWPYNDVYDIRIGDEGSMDEKTVEAVWDMFGKSVEDFEGK